ncbi:MAG: hypothetical protein AAF502_14725 [Bacteroidota bacterium]
MQIYTTHSKTKYSVLNLFSGYGFWTANQLRKLALLTENRGWLIRLQPDNKLRLFVKAESDLVSELGQLEICCHDNTASKKLCKTVIENALVPPPPLHFPVTEIKKSEAFFFDLWCYRFTQPGRYPGFYQCHIPIPETHFSIPILVDAVCVSSCFSADHFTIKETGLTINMVRKTDRLPFFRKLVAVRPDLTKILKPINHV